MVFVPSTGGIQFPSKKSWLIFSGSGDDISYGSIHIQERHVHPNYDNVDVSSGNRCDLNWSIGSPFTG